MKLGKEDTLEIDHATQKPKETSQSTCGGPKSTYFDFNTEISKGWMTFLAETGLEYWYGMYLKQSLIEFFHCAAFQTESFFSLVLVCQHI